MTVTPLPGVKPDRLLAVLEQVHSDLGNKTGAVTGTSQRFAAYIQWANDSVGLLRKMVDLLGRYSKPSDWDKLHKTVEVKAAGHGSRADPPPVRVVRRPSDDELAELAKAYRAGMSLRELAVRYGWSKTALIRYLRQERVELRPKGAWRRR